MIMLRGAGVGGAAGWGKVKGRKRCGVGGAGASTLKQLE